MIATTMETRAYPFNTLYGPAIRAPRCLVVEVRDRQQSIDRSSPSKRWFRRANAAGLARPVSISPATVRIATDELARYIRRISGAP